MLAFVLGIGCRADGTSPAPPERGRNDARGTSPSTQITPAVRSLLAVGRSFDEVAATEEAWSAAELGRVADEVRRAIAKESPAQNDPAQNDVVAATALNEVVFVSLGFRREVDDTSVAFVLLPSVLRTRRGSCVGLGTLYLALGDMLGIPMEGFVRPGHFFVRIRDGNRIRNVELLRKGEEMTDDWYRTRFPIPRDSGHEYDHALSPAEVLGVIEYDIGSERRRQGRLAEARVAFERARTDFPDFAEAHASLGATLHLLGALDEAAHSYRAARRASPGLPGLDHNIEILELERAGRSDLRVAAPSP